MKNSWDSLMIAFLIAVFVISLIVFAVSGSHFTLVAILVELFLLNAFIALYVFAAFNTYRQTLNTLIERTQRIERAFVGFESGHSTKVL